MKWTVKLVAEPTPGHPVEQEIAILEREDLISPATVGLSIAESKQILENLQKQIVMMQVQHHNASLSPVFAAARTFARKATINPRSVRYMGLCRCGCGTSGAAPAREQRIEVTPRS